MTEFSQLDRQERDKLYERAKQVLINAAITGDVVRRAAQRVMSASPERNNPDHEPD